MREGGGKTRWFWVGGANRVVMRGWLGLGGLGFGQNGGSLEAHEVKFAAGAEFPLHLLAGLQTDGGRQGEGKAHVEPGISSARAYGLDAQGLDGFNFV